MSKSIKLLSITMAIFIFIAMLVGGAYALENNKFNVSGSIVYEPPVAPIEVLHDDTNNYYYVEMGTYNSEPIKWKYVGYVADGKTEGEAEGAYIKCNNPSDAKTKKGIFIQQTRGYTNSISWNNEYIYNSSNYTGYHAAPLEDVQANDYATSNIRKFLTETGEEEKIYTTASYDSSTKTYSPNESGTKIKRLKELYNIPDAIYDQIEGRSLSDLYKANYSNGNDVPYPTNTNMPNKDTTVDKLWLLSYQEVNTLLGSTSADRKWVPDATTGSGESFWLRSPRSGSTDGAYYVYYDGFWNNSYVRNTYAARAAFILGL